MANLSQLLAMWAKTLDKLLNVLGMLYSKLFINDDRRKFSKFVEKKILDQNNDSLLRKRNEK